MNIYLYNHQYSRVFNICRELLSTLNFDIQSQDKSFGIIRAHKSTSMSRIFDLKFICKKETISITIFPGILTSDFETISYDEITAGIFSEALLHYLNNEELNSFRLSQEDYLVANAF